jgi:hypothetical protein
MNPKKTMYENQAATIIQHLEKRNMSGYYFDTKEEAAKEILSRIPDQTTVSFGGSMTLNQLDLIQELSTRSLTLLDRSKATTPAETKQIYRDAFSADYYLMSTNAITLDGKLVNIDGNSNRVAALSYGPDYVFIVAGMNKVTLDEASAIERVSNFSAPANTVRLNCKTPCAKTGQCSQCLVEDCICCNLVITRKSRHTNRIHVFLIGEELGFNLIGEELGY